MVGIIVTVGDRDRVVIRSVVVVGDGGQGHRSVSSVMVGVVVTQARLNKSAEEVP